MHTCVRARACVRRAWAPWGGSQGLSYLTRGNAAKTLAPKATDALQRGKYAAPARGTLQTAKAKAKAKAARKAKRKSGSGSSSSSSSSSSSDTSDGSLAGGPCTLCSLAWLGPCLG
jgi:hypothetical protein